MSLLLRKNTENPVVKLNSHKVKPAREDVFRSLPVPSALRIMILPSVISQLIVLIYNMADTFYVGQTNNPYMVAATSLILPMFNISICIAGLAGVGGGSLVSRLLGQGREDEARRVGTFSIYLGLSIAALFALAMGLFMRPILGLLGAGVATCISNCVACAYFIVVVLRSGKGAVVTFSPRVGLAERSSISAVFAVGVPSAVTSFLFDLDYVILDRLMTSYNDLALAAIGIVLKVERFPLNVGVGICQGMMPLVGYNYSAGNRKRLRDTMRLSLGLGLVIAAVSILLYELFATPLIRLFLDDAETVRLASSFLRARVLATPLMFMSFFTVYLFQAFGKGNISLLLGTVRWLGFNIPMLYLLNHLVGMYGLVWSQVTADSLNVIVSIIVYLRFRPPLLRRDAAKAEP